MEGRANTVLIKIVDISSEKLDIRLASQKDCPSSELSEGLSVLKQQLATYGLIDVD